MANYTITEDPKKKGIDLYYKLHKCLTRSLSGKAQNGDELSCHTNNIIRYLAKSIESNEEWYDASVDAWCDYFLSFGANNFEAHASTPQAFAEFLCGLPVLEGPWDDAFRAKHCKTCEIEDCAHCPHGDEKKRIEEYLATDAERNER